MITFFSFIDKIVTKLANRETDPINQARVKMLVYILISYVFFSGTLIIAYTLEAQTMQLIRATFIFFFSILFIIIIGYTNLWRLVSHALLILLTLAVLSNLSIYVQTINIATLQYIWLACAFSFYMLGPKWGWLYASINILPILAYHAIDQKNFFFIGSGPQTIHQITYLYVITYDFFLILFLHYYFFRAFDKNFINLTETKNKLNTLNEKLKETLLDVEKLSNARMDFLSTMSHELRTPLNGIIGMSNSLSLQNPREDQQESLAILKFSTENLLSLVNNVLDFNKLDSEKAELEHTPFDLAALIRNNCASVLQRTQEKMLAFNIFIDPEIERKTVFGDPTRLTQIILNLLNNAIKFTEKGSITLSAKHIHLSDDSITIRFTIEDTGIGIEPDQKDKIFEAYMQGDTHTNRHYGGTGLGLPIVKKILDMLGSTIKLESTPAGGSKFFFNLHFRYELNMLLKTNPIPLIDTLPDFDVLVVEDNAVNIHVLKKTLEQWGIIPTVAENGIVALEILERQNFDVILMDLYMPLMDGFETTKEIRNLSNEKSTIPIIALSATVNNEVAEKVINAGMNDYLSKPFNPNHLLKKLQKIQAEKTSIV